MRQFFRITGQKSVYIASAFVGILSGLFASLFAFLLEKLTHQVYFLNHAHSEKVFFFFPDCGFNLNYDLATAFLVVLFPVLGGLFSGIVTTFFAPEAHGMGTDSMIEAFHHKEGRMNPKIPFIKSIATILTLSSGGSGGKEGPISQIGAGLGSLVADVVKAGARARRALLLAGTAGGLGAIFHAPLGGALTAAEMVYKEDVEADALIPCILSSSTAYLVNQKFFSNDTVFQLKNEVSYDYYEFPFYFLLGFLCYYFGKWFILFFNKVQEVFQAWKFPIFLKPAIGGMFVGLVALLFPEVTGTGEKFLQRLLNGEFQTIYSTPYYFSILLFLILFALKTFTTSLTIGSGGSAGVFGPSLFLGGLVGGMSATIAKVFLGIQVSEVSFMLVGMGAFYSGIASAPIAGMIMVCEMIGSYELLPPLMIVTIISFTLSGQISIYKNQLLNRFSSPAHFWDMNQDIMSKIRLHNISEYFRRYAIIPYDKTLSNIEKLSEEIHASDFVVTSRDNYYFGFLSLRKLKHYHESRDYIQNLVIAMDLADTNVPPVPVTGTLKDAFDTILREDIDKVPIVRTDGFVLGYLRISDLFNIYYKFIKKK